MQAIKMPNFLGSRHQSFNFCGIQTWDSLALSVSELTATPQLVRPQVANTLIKTSLSGEMAADYLMFKPSSVSFQWSKKGTVLKSIIR